ncbi:tumor necrosis factor receptor superfamily member 10A-like [Pelodytes ibericus]
MAPSGEHTIHAFSTLSWIIGAILLILPCLHGFPHRQVRDEKPEVGDTYYYYGIKCKMCPAGTYVETACTVSNTIGMCLRCTEGSTYSEGLSGLNHCQTCTTCREDQEEVSPCTRKKNTACRCKEGTFCLQDQPCEVCQRCNSCQTGLVVKHPCNATSDTQCGPPNLNYRLLSRPLIISLSAMSVFIIFFFLLVLCRAKKDRDPQVFTEKLIKLVQCNSHLSNQDSPRAPVTLDFVEGTKEDMKISTGLSSDPLSMWGSKADDLFGYIAPPLGLIVTFLMHFLCLSSPATLTSSPLPPPTFSLIPSSYPSSTDLRLSFYIFDEIVKFNDWGHFMRQLRVSDRTIHEAQQNHPGNMKEQHYAMLVAWQESTADNVNHLLDALRAIGKKHDAKEITKKLLETGNFVERTHNGQ